jgi:hypothetical protein
MRRSFEMAPLVFGEEVKMAEWKRLLPYIEYGEWSLVERKGNSYYCKKNLLCFLAFCPTLGGWQPVSYAVYGSYPIGEESRERREKAEASMMDNFNCILDNYLAVEGMVKVINPLTNKYVSVPASRLKLAD